MSESHRADKHCYPKMYRQLLVALLLSIGGVFALGVKVPEGWSKLDVPSQMPPAIKSMIRVSAPSGDAEVWISEMEVVMSLDEAAESYVRGMAKRGFEHQITSTVTHNGHEGRHIKGEITLPDNDDKIPVEAYLVLTPDSLMSAAVTGPRASSTINEVLGWIQTPTAVAPPKTTGAAATEGRSFWEILGMGAVFAAVGYAVVNAISSGKRKRDIQTRMASGDNDLS
jgi:hypothetical protein